MKLSGAHKAFIALLIMGAIGAILTFTEETSNTETSDNGIMLDYKIISLEDMSIDKKLEIADGTVKTTKNAFGFSSIEKDAQSAFLMAQILSEFDSEYLGNIESTEPIMPNDDKYQVFMHKANNDLLFLVRVPNIDSLGDFSVVMLEGAIVAAANQAAETSGYSDVTITAGLGSSFEYPYIYTWNSNDETRPQKTDEGHSIKYFEEFFK